MKATNEQVLAAVDGEMCKETGGKAPYHPFPTWTVLNCANLNLESLILATAEKISSSTQPCCDGAGYPILCCYWASSLKLEWICPCSPPLSISAPGLGLRRKTMRVPGRRKPQESAGPVLTSSHFLFNAPSMRFAPRNFQKSAIAILHSRSAGDIKGHYRHCQDVAHGYLQHAQEERAVQP